MAYAHKMMWLTRGLAIALLVTVGAIWIFWEQLGAKGAQISGLPLDPASIGPAARLAGAGLMLLGASIQAYGLWCLSHTFCEAAQGRALSDAAISGFQRFSWSVLLMVPISVLIRAGVIAVVSAADSLPGGFMPIEFGSGEVRAAFVGLLLVFVAQVFRQGQAAEIENRAFI